MVRRPPSSAPFPYPTLFESALNRSASGPTAGEPGSVAPRGGGARLAACIGASTGEVQDGAHSAVRRTAETRQTARSSEEHTSELQSRQYLVCRLLLEKKNDR